jgi:cytochrome c peroxidase
LWAGLLPLVGLILLAACQPAAEPAPSLAPRQAQSLALSADGRVLAVVNPDSDSLSIVDTESRSLRSEIALAPRPAPGPDGRYEPRLGPRSVDLSPDGRIAYVACQWSGQVLTVDVEAGTVRSALTVGAEPVSVLRHGDGSALYVSVYQSAQVLRLLLLTDGTPTLAGAIRQTLRERPWGLALDADGQTLFVSRFLLDPGIDRLAAATLTPLGGSTIAQVPLKNSRLIRNGEARGLYSLAVRPRPAAASSSAPSAAPAGDGEIWVGHLLLNVTTAQPDLDFESTVFPAVTVQGLDGTPRALLSTDSRLPGIDGELADIVSGPRSLAFTPDGRLALLVSMSSEDVLVIDAERKVQAGLVRPLPGDLPEGIVVSPDGLRAYVDERASGDIAVLRIAAAGESGAPVRRDGEVIRRLASGDPMPAELRLGQRLFYSANSSEFPMTRNFWVACASCHLEGRSDAVTWRFSQGPRDTPSNAGGTRDTGFLLRTAGRNTLVQYDETARAEQGADIDSRRPQDRMLLDALSAYVDRGIPFARSPERDPETGAASPGAERGREVFSRLGCGRCHSGPRFTDSGSGNPSLDLRGPLTLHDIGTCASAPHPDKASPAYDGSPREACRFDTPSLSGLFDTPPYLHDGSAATLQAVIEHKLRFFMLPSLSAAEMTDLVAYLRSL